MITVTLDLVTIFFIEEKENERRLFERVFYIEVYVLIAKFANECLN